MNKQDIRVEGSGSVIWPFKVQRRTAVAWQDLKYCETLDEAFSFAEALRRSQRAPRVS